MDFLSDIVLAGKLNINSVGVESTSMEGLFRASSGEITKRTLGTMALQATANYYNTVDADARFLQNVTINLPSIFNVTTSNAIPSAPGLVAALANQAQNTVFAAPSGFTGTPSFRSLVIADTTGLQTALDAKVSGAGTSGYLAKYTGGLTLGNSVIFESGGNINIGGNSTPASRLSFQNNVASLSGRTTLINLQNGVNTSANSIPAYSIGFGNASQNAYTEYHSGTVNDNLRGHRFFVNEQLVGYFLGNGWGYFAGNLGIGIAPNNAGNINISSNLTGSTTVYGIANTSQIQSGVTSIAYYNYAAINTQAASFTLGAAFGYFVTTGTIGAGNTVNNMYGFAVSSGMVGGTNTYGFYGNLAAGSNRWNIYMNGTANNYFNGNVWVGTNAGNYKLDVVGDVNTSTFYRIGGVRVGEWGQFQNHAQFTSFASLSNWGANFINGSAADMPSASTQWHVLKLGIGKEYPGQATYLAFGRPFLGYFDGKIYLRGIYGGVDSGWIGVGGAINNYTIDRGEYVAQYKGFLIEEEPGDLGMFLGKDVVNGGIMFEISVTDVGSSDVTIYQNWISPEDGRMYYVSPTTPHTKYKYLIEGEGSEGTTYSGSAPISVSGGVISIATASSSQAGALSSTDWNTFNNKFSIPSGGTDGQALIKSGSSVVWGTVGGGGSFTGSGPISVTGSVISIATANSSQAGAISSTDWNTFNNKLADGFTANYAITIKNRLSLPTILASGIWSSAFLQFDRIINGVQDYIGSVGTFASSSYNEIQVVALGIHGLLLQSYSGNVKLQTTGGGKVTIQGVEFDMSGIATGKVLKATSSTKAEWVNP